MSQTDSKAHKGQIKSIQPHGGQLINRLASPQQKEVFLSKANFLPRVQLTERSLSDLELIAIGGFSPLTGFLGKVDYESVVLNMRLANGLPWSIPITLPVTSAVADSLTVGSLVRLDDPDGIFIGVLELSEKYKYDKLKEALHVYR
ncbi:MAG: sulfate adenylyltransferase, partial [Pseudanabaenaceae cyanobacterium]